QHRDAVGEDADDNRRNTVQRVCGETNQRREAGAAVLGHVDAADDADWDRHQRRQPADNQRADDRVRHAAADLADRLRHLHEECDVERKQTLADHEEQHEEQRHQRDQHRPRAKGDEHRRERLAPDRRGAAETAVFTSRHAGSAAGCGVGSAAPTTAVALRVIDQMSRRDSEVTVSGMMNSTSPISTRAARYRSSAASVNSFAITAAIVYCGANSDSETRGLFPMTIVTAIVSPSARPKPSITAPTIPVRA